MSSCLSASFCPLITNVLKICLQFVTCLSETLSNTCSVDVMDWTTIPLVLTDRKNIQSVSTDFNWFNFRTTPPEWLDFTSSYQMIRSETFRRSNCLVFTQCYATIYKYSRVFEMFATIVHIKQLIRVDDHAELWAPQYDSVYRRLFSHQLLA